MIALAACAGNRSNVGDNNVQMPMDMDTPTVDYIERLDVYSAPHKDSFLNQLAMNYRSYAVYNARTSGYPDIGEQFAQKAVAAFSGEVPFPETMDTWRIDDDQESFALSTAYDELMNQLKDDASDKNPELAAEAQAKYDCWLSATASGQMATANECRDRFQKTLVALRDCKGGKIVSNRAESLNHERMQTTKTQTVVANDISTQPIAVKNQPITNASNRPTDYYPETRTFGAMNGAGHAREGVIIVNNVNVPEHLINPVPVQPMVFNQNIYSDGTVCNGENDCDENGKTLGEESVSRSEFINMMMAMREELKAINARLDKLQANSGEKTTIKVQQIPLEPTQHVMEEVFEVRFDFNKAVIKPEYEELIQKLANATQENKNIKVSVVGHTDTMGNKNYNYALGGRRAEAVQKMLVKYGIPSGQIVAVSAGEEDLAVPTADGVANADNRRVRVVKEVHYTEPARNVPVAVVTEYSGDAECGMYGCEK